MKQPIEQRMRAAKSPVLFEPKASLPDSLQGKLRIAAVSCDEDLVRNWLTETVYTCKFFKQIRPISLAFSAFCAMIKVALLCTLLYWD